MSKIITLKENRDFRRLYRQSTSYVSPALVVYFKETHAGFCRLGITAGKKIGTAVLRNRAKRVVREAYKAVLPKFNKSVDMVIVARKKAAFVKTDIVLEELEILLKKANLVD